jgi:hypothetical protein
MDHKQQVKYTYNNNHKMLKHIIDLLQIDEFYEGSHNIQVAKGLYSYETGVKDIYKQKKRMNLLKKRNKETLKWLKKEL